MNSTARLTRADFKPATMLDVLLWRAWRHPERKALTFLLDGESNEVHLTYGELDRKARAIAATLQSFTSPGERVVLLYPPGVDYVAAFWGCLYAGVIAVPAYPPDPMRLDRTVPRLQAILSDAQAVIVLTTSTVMAVAEFLFAQAPDLGALQWLATDKLPAGVEHGWQEPAITGGDLAFLQYTSGSTRQPRGVMVTHANLLHNSGLIARAFEMNTSSIGVIWLPPYHDMGLIGGILQPLFSGVPVVLLSPLDFLQRPLRWLKAISRYQATTSGGPNFAYDLCVRKATPAVIAELDLSSWSLAFSGAEPVHAATIDRFSETFAPCGFRREAFYPCYGLAEGTLIVSGGQKAEYPKMISLSARMLEQGLAVEVDPSEPAARELVGCGTSLDNQRVRIVDPEEATECPPGKVGEIWACGPSMAMGYWNRPEESAQVFEARLQPSGEGPYMRTGDFGFLVKDELFVTGRMKDLIIIDGLNHYPQDIEQTVENCHPVIRPGCSAAFSVEIKDEEKLIVLAEVELKGQPLIQAADIYSEIRKAVSTRHDLRVYDVVLLKARSIPKTSSGKIQRHACRSAYLNKILEVWGD